jgi:hypothetical protein
MVLDYTLSIVYSASQYSSYPDFQGFEVYYKIYPGKTIDFSRLVADQTSVNLSPTINQLLNLGYFQMSQASASGPVPLTVSLNPTLIKVADQTKITLDFGVENYELPLSTPTSPALPQPLLEYNGSTAGVPLPYLFRTYLLAGNAAQSFNSLSSWGTAAGTMDMAGVDTNGLNQYEINVFIVAYGLSSTLQPIYSTPVPWGVIRSPH